MAKRAFITGITGQDGAYLARDLLARGYEVYGGARRSSSSNYWRLETLGIDREVRLISIDLAEESNINRVIAKHEFDHVYNLAAQSFVAALI